MDVFILSPNRGPGASVRPVAGDDGKVREREIFSVALSVLVPMRAPDVVFLRESAASHGRQPVSVKFQRVLVRSGKMRHIYATRPSRIRSYPFLQGRSQSTRETTPLRRAPARYGEARVSRAGAAVGIGCVEFPSLYITLPCQENNFRTMIRYI